MRTLPFLAIALGIAGLIPFLAGSLGALSLDEEGRRVALLGLAGYGAVILSFLGGVHWGLALAGGESQGVRAQRLRFGLGVVPALVGWAALLVIVTGWPKLGVALLAAGFAGVTMTEARAARAGLVPGAYMLLRWVLSVVVVVCLVTVCVVLALGGRIIL